MTFSTTGQAASCGPASATDFVTINKAATVTLDHTNQTTSGSTALNVTATISGSATGGAWSSSGSGNFSSTNALSTSYTPSAADVTAGSIKLIFTTTGSAGLCSVATATNVVTITTAVDPAKVVFIKADDFKTPNLAWTNFLQVSRDAGIKVGIGVIVSNIIGKAATAQWMQAQQAAGDVEFWNHGWDHAQWTQDGLTVSEFEGSGLPHMQQHMADAQAGLYNALGRDAIAFGTGYNGFDSNTAAVVNDTAAMRLFFTHTGVSGRRLLDARVAPIDLISESDGTGNPNATKFMVTFPPGTPGPISLQFHPPNFDAAHLLEYQKIVQYLVTNGYTMILPSEYVASLPQPSVVLTLPATNITAGGAVLTGSVNPNGRATSYYFRYGVTSNYGSYTTTNTLPAGTIPVAVSNSLTGLVQGTSYHFSLVATNSAGSSLGTDRTFTTSAIAAPRWSGATLASGGDLHLTFTSSPGGSFRVWFTTNLAVPFSNWSVLGTPTEGPAGQYQFVDQTTNNAQRFYRISSP